MLPQEGKGEMRVADRKATSGRKIRHTHKTSVTVLYFYQHSYFLNERCPQGIILSCPLEAKEDVRLRDRNI